MPREARIILDPQSPALDYATQLITAIQAGLPPGTSAGGILAAALTMTRNAFALHTRERDALTYFDGLAAASAAEIRGSAERAADGMGIPPRALYQGEADRFASRVSLCLSMATDGPTFTRLSGPIREAS